jgi:hypothetical protein
MITGKGEDGANNDNAGNDLQGARNAQKEHRNKTAPKGVQRVDIPKTDPHGNPLHGQQPHVHLMDKRAINQDGTFKHGVLENGITNDIKDWLIKNGWKLR